MALRPGSRLEMSSHFMPLPRSSMIKESSSGDHLLCFLAGLSAEWGGMARFTGSTGGPPTGGALRFGVTTDGAAGSRCAGGGPGWIPGTGTVDVAEGGTEAGRGCCGGDTEDSLEPEPLRREAISTVTVSRRSCPGEAGLHTAPGSCAVPRRGGAGACCALREMLRASRFVRLLPSQEPVSRESGKVSRGWPGGSGSSRTKDKRYGLGGSWGPPSREQPSCLAAGRSRGAGGKVEGSDSGRVEDAVEGRLEVARSLKGLQVDQA